MPAGARHKTPDAARPIRAALPADDPSLSGTHQLIGNRYLRERPLGKRGAVFSARDATGARFAVKTGPRASIDREHGVVASLAHPNIVRCLDRVETDSGPVLVFEYLPGGDLVSLTGAAPRHWLPAAAGLVEALAAVHAAGFVHRDLKARNVLFDRDGRARLIDFGSALPVGSPFSVGGTTAAAVPPRRGPAPVGANDDVYALAALLHELICGYPPGLGRPRAEDPPAPMPLTALISARLAARHGAAGPSLADFAAGIKSLLGSGGNAA